jgi:hypothetical protein
LDGESTLFSKEITSKSTVQNRREIWIEGGIRKNSNDMTDYESIDLAIGVNEPVSLENFELTKKYNILFVSQKELR